jgi:hypothetical protein
MRLMQRILVQLPYPNIKITGPVEYAFKAVLSQLVLRLIHGSGDPEISARLPVGLQIILVSSRVEWPVVAYLVEVLSYRSKGHGFEFRLGQWDFSMTLSSRQHYGPGVDSASSGNEYPRYLRGRGGGVSGRCEGLSTFLPSCTYFLEILGAPASLRRKGLFRLIEELLYIHLTRWVNPAFCVFRTRDCVTDSKVSGALSSPLINVCCRVRDNVEPRLHFPLCFDTVELNRVNGQLLYLPASICNIVVSLGIL